jgi:hypothetical protein
MLYDVKMKKKAARIGIEHDFAGNFYGNGEV